MSKLTDQQYLKNEQYKDATNFNARLEIPPRFSTNPYGWNRWVFDTLETLPKQAHILELGCGPAYLWMNNAGRIPIDWNITLSDLSDGMLGVAGDNLSDVSHSFEFKQVDAQSIPFNDQTFDAVIANHMIYHIPDRSKAIAEIRRVLKQGGRLFATTLGDHHMDELNIWLRRVRADPDFVLYNLPFTLESGLPQLQPYFRQVEIRRYEDSFQVTEIEPLIAYVRSWIYTKEFSEFALAKLRSDLERELESSGTLFFTKDYGLFEALK